MKTLKTLKALLMDELRSRKLMSWEDVKELAESNGFKSSTAERRLRDDGVLSVPCIKLNARKKPIKESERIYYYRWNGGSTVLKK